MTRIDTARLRIDAAPDRVFTALIDPTAWESWLPPEGMTGRIEHFDARPGGTYRMVLSYDDPSDAPGKTTEAEDLVEGRFVEITEGVRVVQEVQFASDDPTFAGIMRMTWEVEPAGSGTLARFTAENVPSGISAEDHIEGLTSSLRNLAAFVDA